MFKLKICDWWMSLIKWNVKCEMWNVNCELRIVICDLWFVILKFVMNRSKIVPVNGDSSGFRWASALRVVTNGSVEGPSGRPTGRISSVCIYTNKYTVIFNCSAREFNRMVEASFKQRNETSYLLFLQSKRMHDMSQMMFGVCLLCSIRGKE